jgi:flavin-dependent dehydrogenase
VLDEVESIARPIPRGSLHLPTGRAFPFELPAPALGISRFTLDALLARRAAELGAEVRCGARVTALERDGPGFRVLWTGAAGEPGGAARAAAAIGAWGRWDALDRALERRFGRERSRYVGWSRDYRAGGDGPGEEVRLFVFRGGYCGLSPIEGERAHVAGVVSERLRRELGGGWESVEGHARRSNPALDRALADAAADGDALGTGPVYFTRKPPASGGVILAGDAAGVLDPFSGEGQASALLGGLLAADETERALAADAPAERLAEEYAAACRRRFGTRFAWSAAFRALMLSPRLGGLAAALAGEKLLELALRKLAKP